MMECLILAVDESYRITLPQPFARRVGWITGDQAVEAWVLAGSSGRSRLLSSAEAISDPDMQAMQEKIAEVSGPDQSLLEFQDENLAVLPLRLMQVQIRRRGQGWRFALPTPIAAIMQIHPAKRGIAALFLQGHIEFWAIETLRAAGSKPLTEMI
ncbi:MAG: hypothetical protein ACHP9V_00315 [Terriglobales bacterium]